MAKMAGETGELDQDADLTTVGGRIEYFRRVLGMSQDDLANALPENRKGGRSRATIALYENGKPVSLQTISDLAPILGLDPSYLAFGVTPEAGSQGQRVPVNRAEWDAEDLHNVILPRFMVAEFDASKKPLEFVRLAVDAPAFGVKARDYLLIDCGCQTMEPDGRLYAVETSVGVALVRSEPTFLRETGGSMHFISGRGSSYSTPSDAVNVAGQVVAVLQRSL